MSDPFAYTAALPQFAKKSKWINSLSGSGPPLALPHGDVFFREAFLSFAVGEVQKMSPADQQQFLPAVQGMMSVMPAIKAQAGVSAPADYQRALQEFTGGAFAALEREDGAWQQAGASPPTSTGVNYFFLYHVFSMILQMKPGSKPAAAAVARCLKVAQAFQQAQQTGGAPPTFFPSPFRAFYYAQPAHPRPPPPRPPNPHPHDAPNSLPFPAAITQDPGTTGGGGANLYAAPAPPSAFPMAPVAPAYPTAAPPMAYSAFPSAPPPSAFPAPGGAGAVAGDPRPPVAAGTPWATPAAPAPAAAPWSAPAAAAPAAAAPAVVLTGWGAADTNPAWRNAIDFSRLAINAIRAGNIDHARQLLQQANAHLG